MFVILLYVFADRWLPTWAVANGTAPTRVPDPRKLATADLQLTWDGRLQFKLTQKSDSIGTRE